MWDEDLAIDLGELSTEIDLYLRLRDRAERSDDPDIITALQESQTRVTKQIQGIATSLGFIGEILDQQREILRDAGLRLELVSEAA